MYKQMKSESRFGSTCAHCRAKIAQGATPYWYNKAAQHGKKTACSQACADALNAEQPKPQPAPAKPTPAGATPAGSDVLNGAKLQKPMVVRHFDSLTAAQACADTQPTNSNNRAMWQGFMSEGSGDGSARWYGVDGGVKKVRQIIREGWGDGRAKLVKMSDEVLALNPPQPVSIRRRRVWGDQGDSVDMGRIYSGQFDQAWQRTSRVTSNSTRYVEILANPAVNCGTDAEVIFWRGAAALVLADMIQGAGYAVSITAIFASHNLFQESPHDCLDLVTVKGYADPLDMDNLASVLCLGGWFRDVWFRMATSHDRPIWSSLGSSRAITDALELAPNQIGNLDDVTDLASARAWIRRQIERLQGAELKEAA